VTTLPAQIAVIAHPNVPVDSMNKSKITDLFTGDVRIWNDGSPVVPLDLQAPKDVRKEFYKALGKSSSRMRSIWMKRKLSGDGDAPASVETEDEVVRRVESTPGAISFVRASHAPPSVKVLYIVPSP
jgi:ABC-type phosphate transport system substrate-binding protein